MSFLAENIDDDEIKITPRVDTTVQYLVMYFFGWFLIEVFIL